MSTSVANRSAPIADEFPVLLRLPDLNTPTWEVPTVPAMEPTADAATQASAKSATVASTSESVASAAVMRLEALSKLTPSVAASSEKANLEASLAATSVDVVADHREPTPEPVSLPSSRMERLTRMEMPAFTRWSLVKQLTTGGVLVGGLALTYLAVMSGGSTETPNHIAQQQTTLEPPVIDVPSEDITPVVIPTNNEEPSPVISSIPEVPPPPFSPTMDRPTDANYPPSPRVAELPDDRWNGTGDLSRPRVEMTNSLPPNRVGPTDSGTSRHEVGEYQGRIGPAPREAANNYPATDPNTYLYRPVPETSPDAGRPGVALNGTIAPLRR